MKSKVQVLLEEIAKTETRIEQMKFELESLEENLTYIRALSYEKIGSGSRKNEAAFEDITDRIVDLGNNIKRDIAELAERKYDAVRLIQRLDNALQEKILHMRYIRSKPFAEIGSELGYDLNYIYKLHKRALEKIEKFLGD